MMETQTENTTNETPQNPLGFAGIPGLIRKYAIPSILTLLISAAYNIADQIFIGQVVGMYGNAATNVAFPVTILTNSLAQLIGVGTAVAFNILMGEKKPDEAKKYVGTGLTLMSFCGVIFMGLVLLFISPILRVCGATESVLPIAEPYLFITAFGLPFFLFTQSASHTIRADGSPLYSTVSMVSGAVINVFLNWLFMYVFNWGIEGAAIATVIGQGVSFLVCVCYFFRFKTFKIKLAALGVNIRYALRIAKLGLPNFINQAIMMAVNIVMNNTLTFYGAQSVYGKEIPLAVSGVVAKLNTILGAFTVGIAQGCQPIFGYNIGAKNYKRVNETYKTALIAVLAIGILFFLALQIFPRQIISIFGTGEELYFEFAESYLRFFLMMVFILGVQPLSINYFSSTGNARQGTILSLSRQGFFLIPLLVLLPIAFGLNGILYAGPIADSLACVLSLSLVYFSFKKMAEQEQKEKLLLSGQI